MSLFDPSKGKSNPLGLGIIFIIAYVCLICLALGTIALGIFTQLDIFTEEYPETPSQPPNNQQISPWPTQASTPQPMNTLAPSQRTPHQQEIQGPQPSPIATSEP